MGWLSGWTYRKTITVPAVTVEQSNINLLISIAYTAGMQDDFDDIRFTSSDGASQLYCYKDSYTASTSAIYAIKVPTIPVAGTTLYMYFGNAIATDPSDGANTFLFFDDFSGDLSQWDVDNPARCIIESGTLKFWGIYGDGSKGCRTKGTYGIHTFARAKMRQITGGVWYKGFSFSESMVINKAYCYWSTFLGEDRWDNSNTSGHVASPLDSNWHYIDLWRIKSNLVQHYFDNIDEFDTSVSHSDAYYVGFWLDVGNTVNPLYVDHVYVGQLPTDETEIPPLSPGTTTEDNIDDGYARVKHTCVASEVLTDVDGKTMRVDASEVQASISGKSIVGLGSVAYTGTPNGQENGGPRYKEATTASAVAISSVATARLIFIKNTGKVYDSTTALGASVDRSVRIKTGSALLAILDAGEPFELHDANGGLDASAVTVETVTTVGGTIASGTGNAVEYFVSQ